MAGQSASASAAHAAGFDAQDLSQARFDLGQLTDRRGAQPLAQGDLCIIAYKVGMDGNRTGGCGGMSPS